MPFEPGSTVQDLKPGDSIHYPDDVKFEHLVFFKQRITPDIYRSLMADDSVRPADGVLNKALIVVSVDYEYDFAMAAYKHDDWCYCWIVEDKE